MSTSYQLNCIRSYDYVDIFIIVNNILIMMIMTICLKIWKQSFFWVVIIIIINFYWTHHSIRFDRYVFFFFFLNVVRPSITKPIIDYLIKTNRKKTKISTTIICKNVKMMLMFRVQEFFPKFALNFFPFIWFVQMHRTCLCLCK